MPLPSVIIITILFTDIRMIVLIVLIVFLFDFTSIACTFVMCVRNKKILLYVTQLKISAIIYRMNL